MANVHNAGKMKFGAKEKGKKRRRKTVFEQLEPLEIAANGPSDRYPTHASLEKVVTC
jgi:hypothetical protein